MCAKSRIGARVNARTGEGQLQSSKDVPQTPCFTAGTMIATDRGSVAIEDIRVGDHVLTRDSGYRPVRWIGARHFDKAALASYPELRPVCFPRGSIAPGMPDRDLTVSPQHRMLLTGRLALDLGGETEILAAAEDFTEISAAHPSAQDSVTYIHILFDTHEIVWANGCWSESFLPEAAALAGLHSAQLTEILTIFPELAEPAGQAAFCPARAGRRTERAPLALVA